MHTKLYTFAVTSLAAIFFSAALISDPIELIVKALEKYREEYPQEKIYIHHDKPYYASGDVIWMKAYLVAGSYHQPSPLSRTIHVELVNSSKEIVQHIKLLSENGFAHGSLQIPDSVGTGRLLLRAYTPWMTNFSTDYFFQKEISVLSAGIQPEVKSEASGSLDVQFFPEGGNLILGLRSKVGFKTVASDGLGRAVNIKIEDESGNEVAVAKSSLLGMGSFELLPEAGKEYYGRISGNDNRWPLPSAVPDGFALTLTNKEDLKDVVLRVQCSPNASGKEQIFIVVQSRGVVSFLLKADLSKNLFIARFPKEKLLSGVNHITILNSQRLPIAERLFFINKQDQLRIDARPLKQTFNPREKTTVTVDVKDVKGEGVSGNFSLAVIDASQLVYPADNASIYAHFLLSSDLRGHIERPGYYFNNQYQDRHDALDALMLTQGWRRFNWKSLLNDEWPTIISPIDLGITISGKLLDIASSKPIQNGKVVYMEPASGALQVQPTEIDGSFKFEGLHFYDSAKVVLQGENKRGNKTVKFTIDQAAPFEVDYVFQPFSRSVTSVEIEYLKRSYERRQSNIFSADGQAIELKAVEVTTDRIKEPTVARAFGKGSATIKPADFISNVTAMHPLQLLQGRVAGVQVSGTGIDYSVTIRGVGSLSGANTPLFMVDNIAVEQATLAALRAQDIETIEVFKGADAAVFGSQGAGGAILFYTKSGRGIQNVPPMGIINVNYGGYASAKEFYVPKYNVSLPEHELPDLRSTIFWAPSINTDSTGRATIEYYNADPESTIIGIIEGIDAYGQTGSTMFSYEVQKR